MALSLSSYNFIPVCYLRFTSIFKTLAAQALGSTHHRIFGLDLLRAGAIFITVYGHAMMLVPPAYQSWHNLPVLAIDG